MNYKVHMKYGSIASVCVASTYVLLKSDFGSSLTDIILQDAAIIFVFCLIGSLIPDLDTNSKPSKIVAFLGFCFGIWALLNREPYPALIFLTTFSFIKTFNHRTFTHIWTLPLVMIIIGLYFNHWVLFPFSFGLIIHYVVDCFGPKTMNPMKLSNWVKPLKIL